MWKLLAVALTVVICSSCDPATKPNPATTSQMTVMDRDDMQARLTIDLARIAIIHLIDSGTEPGLDLGRQWLTNEKLALDDIDGWTVIGPWKINLSTKKFNLALTNASGFQDWSGTFDNQKLGGWVARVERHRQTL